MSEIQIIGAGMQDEVNGFYRRVENYNGAACYTMEGSAGLSYFLYYDRQLGHSTPIWRISSATRKTTLANVIYFYKCDPKNETSRLLKAP
jgi:hypothetical protein